ncbi:MAG: hypothetical protein Q7T81_14760 [Pseudolabrys sp.]|nr:hypothetical protein [Pseudolabrys sp.]
MADDNNDDGSAPPDLEEVLTKNDWQSRTAWFPPEPKPEKPKPTRQATNSARVRDEKKSEKLTQLQVWAPTNKPAREAISKVADAIANDRSKLDVVTAVMAHSEIHDFLRSLVNVLDHNDAGSDLFVALQAVMSDENVRDLVLHFAGRAEEELDAVNSAGLRELLVYLGRNPAFRTLCLALTRRPQLRSTVTALIADPSMGGCIAKTVEPGPARNFFVSAWAAGPQIQEDLATALARPDALKIAVRVRSGQAINTVVQNPQAADLGLRVLRCRGPAGWIVRQLIGSPH